MKAIKAPDPIEDFLLSLEEGSLIESSDNDRYSRESRARKEKQINAPKLKIKKQGEKK